MTRRILAMLLVMAMVFSVLPTGVFAEGENNGGSVPNSGSQSGNVPAAQGNGELFTEYNAPLQVHDHAAGTDDHVCEHCIRAGKSVADAKPQWVPWGETAAEKAKLPTEAKNGSTHFYLVSNIDMTTHANIASGEITICLNGYDITGKSSSFNIFRLPGNSNNQETEISILDCTAKVENGEYVAGTIQPYNNKYVVMTLDSTTSPTSVNLYDGIITGCKTNTGSVAMLKKNSAFNMYGGQISGNTGGSGIIYLQNQARFSMQAGTITNNTATNGGVLYTLGTSNAVTITGGTIINNTATVCGGVLYANAANSVTIANTIIRGNQSNGTGDTDGGGVLYTKGSTVTITNTTLDGNTAAKNGGAIYANGGSVTFTNTAENAAGCTVGGNAATGNGGAVYSAGANVTMTSGTYSGNTAANGGAVYAAGGKVTATNAAINGNGTNTTAATAKGGAIYNAGAEVTVVGGTMNTNKANRGGALYVESGSVGVTNTVMDQNAAAGDNYAGAIMQVDGNVSLTGAQVTGSTAGYAAAIRADAGTLTLKDTAITGSRIGSHGNASMGTVYVTNLVTFTLKGETRIVENVDSSGTASNLFMLQSSPTSTNMSMITLDQTDPLRDNAMIGITLNNNRWASTTGGQFISKTLGLTDVTGPEIAKYFSSDHAARKVVYSAADDKLKVELGHKHMICGTTCADPNHSNHQDLYFDRWTNPDELPVSGNWYLDVDVTVKADKVTKRTSGELNLCLNGKTVTAENNAPYIFDLNGTAKVNVCDCEAKTEADVYAAGKLDAPDGKIAVFIRKESTDAQFNLYDGIISGCAGASGCVANVQGAGMFTMYDGQITGNTAGGSGMVYIAGSAQFNLLGGKITGNTGGASGLFYLTGDHAQINIKGGTIEGNNGSTNGTVYLTGAAQLSMVAGTVTNNTATNGAFVYLNSDSSSATITGGSITNNTAAGNGGVIYAAAKGDVTISNVTISGNKANGTEDTSGGGVLYTNGGQIQLFDVTLEKNAAAKNAGAIYANGGSVTLENCILRDNDAGRHGGAVYTGSGAALVLISGSITDNTATGNGGGIYAIDAGSTVTLNGCVLTGNQAAAGGAMLIGSRTTLDFVNGMIAENTAGDGGGLYISTYGAINMTGGEISGNTATGAGGGVYHLKSTGTYAGGKIANNTAAKNGGGIYSKESTLQISGGEITGNKSACGGVYFTQTSAVTISGEPVITDNTANERASNLYLGGTAVIALGQLGENAKIAVSADQAFRNISEETDVDDSGRFLSDAATQKVIYRNKALFLAADGDHKHCLCSAQIPTGCDHKEIVFAAWEKTNSLPSTGNWYLNVDVTLTAATQVQNENLNLCLNGHTITVDAKEHNIMAFNVKGTTILNITDCSAKPGKITGATNSVIFCNNGSAAKIGLYNGLLTENSGNNAGAVMLQSGSVLNMYGGKITNNTHAAKLILDENGEPKLDEDGNQTYTGATGGGAVSVYMGTTQFNMYGGEVSGNKSIAVTYLKDGKETKAGGDGGAIYADGAKTQINVYGGKISDNAADANGGAIYLKNSGKVNLKGGTISGNSAKSKGGAVYVTGGVVVTLDGAELSGNESANGGAILTESKSHLEFISGKVTGNKAVDGAGLYVTANNTLNMTGGEISGNIATGSGGGICQLRCEAKITGGTISGNEAVYGGGIMCRGGTLYLKDVNIIKNTATKTGGGLRIARDVAGGKTYYGKAELIGGSVSKNTAPAAGGIMLEGVGCELVVTGSTLAENKATETYGGAIYAEKGTKLELNDSKLTGNTAKSSGGAVYATGVDTVVTLTGSELSGNEAANGGAVLIASRSHLEFVSGKVTGNHATSDGGGLYITTNTTFNMTGGELSGNTANGNGGGLALLRCEANLTGGQVSGNVADYGGGILCRGAVLNLKGTAIIQNTANRNGGGIKTGNQNTKDQIYTAKVTMSDGMISQNTANLAGGVILEGAGCEMVLTGGEISQNTAKTEAGGIYVSTKTAFAMEGGKIADNSANNGGGMVMLNSTGTFTGGEMTGNAAKSKGGALYITNENAVATFQGTTVSKNTAAYGGGVLVANRAVMNLKSGKFTNNTAVNNGGALYISTNSSLNMHGGSVTGNSVAKDTGGGIYGLRATLNLYGGTVSYNTSKIGGGGIMGAGSAINLKGVHVTYNTAKSDSGTGGTGGGVRTNTQTVKSDGVETVYASKIVMTAGTIANNTAGYAGGGVLVNGPGAEMEMSGGVISDNTTTLGGGMYVSTKTTLNMTGGEICRNQATSDGGAIWFAKKTSHEISNAKLYENTSGKTGGAIYFHNDAACTFADVKFSDNTSGGNGGAIMGQPGANPVMVRCTFTNNTSTEGKGGAVYNRLNGTFEDCVFIGNQALNGGALHLGQSSLSVNGWGTQTRDDVGVFITRCTFENNTATEMGGAVYLMMSAFTDMKDTTFKGNTSGTEGSAIWAEEDLTMTNVTVTGNTSEADGYAVYLAGSEFDGQSYFKGLMKMGGNMVIKDNQGGDMYLDAQTVVGALAEGYGKDTHVCITLDSGLLTQRVYGSYNYEGGNCVYTITHGDRSLTDPEGIAIADDETEPTEGTEATQATESASENAALYAGIGAFAVVIVAAAVIVVAAARKKKKAEEPAEEVSEN